MAARPPYPSRSNATADDRPLLAAFVYVEVDGDAVYKVLRLRGGADDAAAAAAPAPAPVPVLAQPPPKRKGGRRKASINTFFPPAVYGSGAAVMGGAKQKVRAACCGEALTRAPAKNADHMSKCVKATGAQKAAALEYLGKVQATPTGADSDEDEAPATAPVVPRRSPRAHAASGGTAVSVKTSKASKQLGLGSFVDHVSKEEDDELRRLYARAHYTSGLPFDALEGEDWETFFKRLCPGWRPPKRKALAGDLLDKEASRVDEGMLKLLAKQEGVTLCLDGLTEKLTKVALVGFTVRLWDGGALLLKEVATGTRLHNAAVMVTLVEELLKDPLYKSKVGPRLPLAACQPAALLLTLLLSHPPRSFPS